jgi:hypothetical protein
MRLGKFMKTEKAMSRNGSEATGGVEEIGKVDDVAPHGDGSAAAPRKLKKKLVKKKKKKKAVDRAVGEGGSTGVSVEDGLLLRSAIKLQRMFRLRK